jgi:general secretion pathway protein L
MFPPSVAKLSPKISRLFRDVRIVAENRHGRNEDVRVARMFGLRIEWLAGQSLDGPAVIFVPAEQIVMLQVDLPAQRRRDRLAALPWAVEDMLAEPVSALHLVLGPEIAPRRYIVAVTRHSAMRGWRQTLDLVGVRRCRIVPDALGLPPAPDGSWSVAIDADRILARTGISTAFAMNSTLFNAAWETADRPPLVLYGDQSFPEQLLAGAIPLRTEIAGGGPLERLMIDGASRPSVDLAQGVYAPEGNAGLVALRRVAAILVAGLLAYTAIFAGDTAALVRLADRRAVDAARLHAEIIPPDRRSADVAGDIAALTRIAVAPHSMFLPLMAKASAALHPFAGEVSLRNLAFSGDDGALTFGLQIRDFAALQRVEAALVAAGIAVETGPAAASTGGVEAKVKLTQEASR